MSTKRLQGKPLNNILAEASAKLLFEGCAVKEKDL